MLARLVSFLASVFDMTGTPVVHLVDVEKAASRGLVVASGRDIGAMKGSGAIDHVAFEAWDIEELVSRLNAVGAHFWREDIPSMDLRQIWICARSSWSIPMRF